MIYVLDLESLDLQEYQPRISLSDLGFGKNTSWNGIF